MRRKRIFLTIASLVGVIAMLALAVSPVQADGIIIPFPCRGEECPIEPPPRPMSQLVIRYHRVEVVIDNQLAVTHVDQVFYNPNDWPIEGTYLFPLPLDAAVSDFTLWVDGKPVSGEVLDAEQARWKYEEIVRSLRDPALLEYAGRGALQASIFPVPAKAERRIELKYTQVLTAENGLVRYVYPLNTEKFSAQPLESVAVTVKVSTKQPVRAIYSPSHPIAVNRQDDQHFTASYEANRVLPDSDFVLYYSTGETEAFHLLTYRDPGDPIDRDGFFLLLLAPRPTEKTQVVRKDVLLVLDRSGSMEGEKFSQAQSALRYILKNLKAEDRFYLSTFSSQIETYADGLRPASDVPDALDWVDHLGAAGSTDINRALLEAAAVVDKERPSYLIFLTDGLPTASVTDSQQILANFARAAPSNLRLFTFGVGYDVDTFLLDSLCQEHHGLSTYVKPGESLDEALSDFYMRISMPVLTDLELDFGNLSTYDLYPNPLPDLFAGSQVVIVGRYRQGGVADVSLSGLVNGQSQRFNYPGQVFSRDSRGTSDSLSNLPRLWATRKIGYLLNRIRLQGPDQETIDQIVKLSIRYGIVTPYTSYLVTEPSPFGAENQKRIAGEAYDRLQAEPKASVSGEGAVTQAQEQGELSQAEVPPPAPGFEQQALRLVGSHAFVLRDGIWIDTAYDPKTMPSHQVAFLSADYFSLAKARPDLAAAFALGERVIVVVDGIAYEIVASDQQTPPIVLPTTTVAGDGNSRQLTPQATSAALDTQPTRPLETGANPADSPVCLGLLLPVSLLLVARYRARWRLKGKSGRH